MDETDLSRREALTKLGKFAAYTAPAMMVLLTSEKAMARSNERDGTSDHDPPDTGSKGTGDNRDGRRYSSRKAKKGRRDNDNC
jgi:hypothetical protein